MSQTDTRPGFRLPWTAERSDAGQPGDAPGDAPTEEPAMETTGEPAGDGTAQPADASVAVDDPTAAEEHVTTDMIDATAITAARRPTKFMADLSRAMQTAAEASRDETMARFASPMRRPPSRRSSTGSADEAAGLRRRADDDVAAVREWSKAEIARIREETEARIAARKAALDGEIDAHAAIIEARVERVDATVDRVRGRDGRVLRAPARRGGPDPHRDDGRGHARPARPVRASRPRSPRPRRAPSRPPIRSSRTPSPRPRSTRGTDRRRGARRGRDRAADRDRGPGRERARLRGPGRERARRGRRAGRSVEGEPEPAAMPDPDFAAAEAEAASFSGDLDDDDGLTKLAESSDAPADEAPAAGPAARASGRVTTRVVVLGLVSVASIATFKRSLGRVSGVSAIGVASGPDGEFVFTVSHDAGLALGDAITALPGFEARSPPRRPTASRSPHTTPTPATDPHRSPRSHPWPVPPSSSPFRRTRPSRSATELLEAGFEVIEVEDPRELERGARGRQDIALAILDGEVDATRHAPTRPPCATPAGRSRR